MLPYLKKKFLLAFAFIILSNLAFAQKGSITGTLLDSADHKVTLNYATISIFKGADTVLTTYKLSDDKGVFKISNLDLGVSYRIVVNAWLYRVLRKELTINTSSPNVDLGKLFLSTQTNTLNEVVIQSERPPIIVRNDTIEFNAESFKTLPSAVVEDLLKKLPGVVVGSDGSIQVNGKSVSKILVDGKEFFGGDQQMATKNLPANIIDKIQVNDDPQAKRRNPDLLAGNTPQIINLKLKKAIKKGAFGKVYAGGGLKELYETGGIMNFFRDTTQISLLAYGNNINKPGFSIADVSRIGGFSRAGINSMMMNTDGGYELNNISFGGTSTGVQKSAGAGANFNTLTKNGIKLNGKYFFGQSNTLIAQLTDVDQTLGSDRLYTNSNSNQRNKSYNHNIGAVANWEIDSLTSLTIEPTITINKLRNIGLTNTESKNLANQLINSAENLNNLKGNTTEYNIDADFWKDFKKAGRSINTTINLSKRDNLSDNFNTSNSKFYFPTSNAMIDQLRDNNINNLNIFVSANYKEPISKNLRLNVSVSSNYIDNKNALSTFYKNPLNQVYDIEVPTLSETVLQSGYKTNTNASLILKLNKDIILQSGLVFNTINLKNRFLKYNSFEQQYQFVAPTFTLKLKDLILRYSPSFNEPDVRYIQPISDNTNPLFIQNGNANLIPAKTHQVSANVYKYDTKNSLNYSFNANGSIENDAVVMSRSISSNGIQINTPINVDGVWQFWAGGNVNKDLKTGKNQFSIGAGVWSYYKRNIVLVNGIRSFAKILNIAPEMSFRLNLNDKIEFGESYSFNSNKSNYSDKFFSNLNFKTHESETELIVRLPQKMVWESTYRIQYNTQTVAGFNNNIQIWNAALTLLFMKNDRAQLKFAVNDILNTNTRRSISIDENSIRDTRTNNLGRHGLVTLTYNIQNFGGKVGGKDTMFRF